ncbi:MAG: hypothetical protein JSS66_16450 [Armatimonadetes bacterium]|nr:hypothetical protein [Armatimonadota bacterium]
MLLSRTVAVLAGSLVSGWAFCQQSVFLQPDQFFLKGRTALVDLRRSSAPSLVPEEWSDAPVKWSFLRTGEVQENRDDIGEWLRPDGRLELKIPASGPIMFGIDFLPRIESVNSTDLRKLTKAPVGAGTVKIRHYRTAVTILRTQWGPGVDSPGSAVATSETSLTSAVHLMMDPSSLMLGGDIAFEVVMRGLEIEDATVKINHRSSGETLVRDDAERYRFTPDKPGVWDMEVQFVRPLKDDPEAQFELYSTTMTFEVPRP